MSIKNNTSKYWNQFYNKKNINFKSSSFVKFIHERLKLYKLKRVIDIGCGNGRDTFFFMKKGYNVTAIDQSSEVIKNNCNIIKKYNFSTIDKPKFLKFDISFDKINQKFDLIYSRFFLHAITKENEINFFRLINKIGKKNSFVCLEFRNSNDEIFKKFKLLKHNDFIEFNNKHFRRVIDTNLFVKKLLSKINCEITYIKSSKNLSIYKKDNPNLTRIIFRLK
jgi:tellurite methyltransferase